MGEYQEHPLLVYRETTGSYDGCVIFSHGFFKNDDGAMEDSGHVFTYRSSGYFTVIACCHGISIETKASLLFERECDMLIEAVLAARRACVKLWKQANGFDSPLYPTEPTELSKVVP